MAYITKDAPKDGYRYGRRNGQWVRIIPSYEIRRNGTKIAEMRIDELKALVTARTLTASFQIGDQLIVPWTNPANGTIYECPFNFGTLQDWTLADGTTKYGLGLQSEYLLPAVNIMFDNKEATNSDSNRKNYGNNRWKDSNIRQWLNARGEDWFTMQHTADAAPTVYCDYPGFLGTLPGDFVDELATVQNKTQTHSVDGGGVDTTEDKFFLLSTYEMNLAQGTNTSTLAADGVEGTPWNIWSAKNNGAPWTSTSDNAANAKRVKHNIENHSAAGNGWLRSANLGASYGVWYVYSSGYFNGTGSALNALRVAPACVIC